MRIYIFREIDRSKKVWIENIYIFREIDRSRKVWIENIFPSSVSGIKLQFRIFTGKLTVQW